MSPWRKVAPVIAITLAAAGLLTSCGQAQRTATLTKGNGPAKQYDCTYDNNTEAFTGAYGTASEIGWQGNHQGVVTCLGGTFFVQDEIDKNFGFGIYDGGPTTWTDLDGYLPAQVTTFRRYGAEISITEFADKVQIGGDSYVAVYCRVAVRNSTNNPVVANPDPTSGLVALNTSSDTVGPHNSVDHDYVLAVDRFGNDYPWPGPQALATAGGIGQHLSQMRTFWDHELSQIAEIDVPDTQLDDAYKSGFIYTQIARSGNNLNTGVNGYEMQFSHDVVGILSNLFNQGYFDGAHALLLEARNVMGAGGYNDGLWTYPWPWAIYLLKTGDLAFVKKNFASEGPLRNAQPSIEDAAHAIAASRTGPSGIMEATDDIDAMGYWTVDDYEALMGLAAYRYIAQRIGEGAQVDWATQEYDGLLTATNSTLEATIRQFDLNYLPCSMLQPNTQNRCTNPQDANWAATLQFGKWAWDAQLFDAQVTGPGIELIDATYDYGLGRLQGVLPANTFGGFPSDYYYSTAYNAGYGTWGLASQAHRDQGILSYEFMMDAQSGPYSWWESSGSPSAADPWIGTHPENGQGSSPHAWGMAETNTVLLDSLLAQNADGSLIVGRGVPPQWLGADSRISVDNFPSVDDRRLGITIASTGRSVSLTLRGQSPSGPVSFELPSFVDDIAAASAGSIDQQAGSVTLSPGTRSVTVQLR